MSAANTAERPRGHWAVSAVRFVLVYLIVVAILFALGWSVWIYVQIEKYAYADEAAPADVICVFGAAEYAGKPSPVLRARLDHALALYEHKIAPVILTLGGSAPGDKYSEGEVGAAYLMANGVPQKAIIAETESRSTDEQVHHIAVIAQTNGYRRVVIVSDPTHLFRIREMFAREGLRVMTSPRPQVATVGSASEWQQVWHEVMAYTAWRMHLN
jgi:uncharacterized SAM-binding protein YcdF (DUF218 family)